MQAHFIKRRLPFLFSFLLLLATSCGSIRLISDYDEITDNTVTSLQEKTSRFFVKLENTIGTKDADYKHHSQFYEDAKVDLNTLKIRADAFTKNRIVQDQVAELNTMLSKLEQLHKIGFVSKEQIAPLRQPFNSAFTAIVKFQLALKRGDKG